MSLVNIFLLIPLLFPGGDKTSKKKVDLELRLHQFPVQGLVKPFLIQPDPNAPQSEVLFGVGDRSGADSIVPSEPDTILEVIRRALGQEAFRGGKARMEIRGGRLIFVGEPELAKKVGDILGRLKSALAPRVRVRCRIVSASGKHEFGVIDPTEVSKLNVIFEGYERGRAGDRMCFGVRGEKVFQGKLDAEVAQEATILDPKPRSLPLGQTLSILALPHPDGKSFGVLGYFLDRDKDAEIRAKDLAGKGLGAMEFSEQRLLKRAFSCKVRSGSSVFIPLGGPEALGLVLQIEQMTPSPEGEGLFVRSLSFASLPLGTYPSTLFRSLFASSLVEEDEKQDDWEMEEWMKAFLETDYIMDFLNTTLDKNGLFLESMGGRASPSLVVSGAQGVTQKAEQVLEFFTKDLMRSFVVDIELQAQSVGNPQGEWRSLRKVVSIPSLSNRSILVETGREKGYLKDYEVEIAQKASIASPIPGKVFIGDRFRAFLAAEGNEVHVFLSLGQQELLGFRRMPPACDKLGPLMAPDLRRIALRRSFSMKIGETVPLGDGLRTEVEGLGECRTRYTLTIRED